MTEMKLFCWDDPHFFFPSRLPRWGRSHVKLWLPAFQGRTLSHPVFTGWTDGWSKAVTKSRQHPALFMRSNLPSGKKRLNRNEWIHNHIQYGIMKKIVNQRSNTEHMNVLNWSNSWSHLLYSTLKRIRGNVHSQYFHQFPSLLSHTLLDTKTVLSGPLSYPFIISGICRHTKFLLVIHTQIQVTSLPCAVTPYRYKDLILVNTV